MTLLPHHLKQLQDSAISDAVISARGYASVPEADAYATLKQAGFSPTQAKNGAQGGLLLPLWTPAGESALVVLRPDLPRETKRGQQAGRPIKYEIPQNSRARIDCPPMCQPMMQDPKIPLWITEGQKKGDSLMSQGACAIALLSVWGFKGKNDLGGTTVVADMDEIAWNGRDVRIVFDSDVVQNSKVAQALERLMQVLKHRKADVHAVYLPAVDGHKVGVDDYFAAGHTLADLEALIEVSRPEPQPAPSTIEILGTSPKSITRPMSLVGGHGYAATWLWVRLTTTEVLTKQGEVVRLPTPRIEDRLERFIVRDDGKLYGDVSDPSVTPLEDISVHLPEPPPPNKLWSAAGVQAYVRGERPDPKTVFEQVTKTIDSFIDFNRSLADQRTMCELVTCYILSTWFIESLLVIGYLWPNGERGSGKTQLLNIVTEMAYLGQTILAGGSYAALRDLADYGATLAFDDAEAIMDVRKTDPDKRALLLAGNRKGNTTPVKEPVNGREWRTRYVNTFCPRLFSAIRMPDPVLASRTIVVPLIRTADRHKANADPLNYALWPSPRERMLDDLWGLGLAHIGTITQHADRASQDATLSGRALEPWLAILTVASWLDNQGCAGMFRKMDDLSIAYQKERPDLEMADLTVLVVRALVEVATGKGIEKH